MTNGVHYTIMCTKNEDRDLREGDIYYRYRGRSERIKYPELKIIIEQTRENEQRLWMKHFFQIAKIGVKDVGIFDLQSGQVTGSKASFIIDESLLSQLSFIKEGEFSEEKGKPVLKIIGVVSPVSSPLTTLGKKQIIKTKGIRIGDIVLSFLNQEKVAEPQEFIRQICFENTAFLPVYYYIRAANMNNDEAIALIDAVLSRSQAKSKLRERISKGLSQMIPIPDNIEVSTRKKKEIVLHIKKEKIRKDIIEDDTIYCLRAIRGLNPDEVKRHFAFIRNILKEIFCKKYASADSGLAGELRRAICWVDEALFKGYFQK